MLRRSIPALRGLGVVGFAWRVPGHPPLWTSLWSAYRIHPGNKTLDTVGMRQELALIGPRLRQQTGLGCRPSTTTWPGSTWARRRRVPALRHLGQAALHGSLIPVARSFATLARRRLQSRLAQAGLESARLAAWRQPAIEWLDRVAG